MDSTGLREFREAKDDYFRHSHDSPLRAELRPRFGGLAYYAPDPDLVFTLPVEPGDGSEVRVGTSDGAERTYLRAGRIRFELGDDTVELTLYSTGHPGYFLPFRDATSGRGSYGAGRYLDLEPNADGTVTVDFNYAYNPTCAYDPAYSCPLPPAENWLRVPIEAGEKDFAA